MARKKTRSEEYAGGFPPGMEAFQNLNDPRIGKAKRHYFGEVLFIALAAMVCGMEGFDDFERFAKLKEKWLRRFLKLPHGTPSDDTFRRIFTALDPKSFVESFTAHVRSICPELAGNLIAIDGKTARHSFDDGDPSNSIHLISAWADNCGLTLGQLLVDGKENEITAVPKLLRQLDLKGTTVSLDAMGTQKKIAQEIHFAGADYVLALKANHETLHSEVIALFEDPASLDYGRSKGAIVAEHDSGWEKGHGRIERRVVKVTDYLDWFQPTERKHWLGLRSLVEITSTRQIKGETSIEKRYYLTSHAPNAEKLGDLVRRHWGIENRCHWVLDVTFDEDQCRVRKGHAAQNLALLRKLTLNLLRVDQTIKDTMRGKRIRAALCEQTLETLMKLSSPE
jgi:predicted transposase YbfD/YdcC